MTSSADLFLGVSAPALDQWLSSLFGTPALRESLFSGTTTQDLPGTGTTTVTWSLQAAPTVTLADPGPLWQTAIGPNGGAPPAQVPNAFTVQLNQLNLMLTMPNQPAEATATNATVLVAAGMSGSLLQISPLGLVVDLDQLSPNEETIYHYIVIPKIMQIVHTALGGYQIPQLSPLGVALSAPSLAVSNGILLTAMNLGGTTPGTPELDGPPSDPVFLLASASAVQAFVNAGVQQLAGTNRSVGGSDSFGIGSASYNASVTLDSVSVQVNSGDLTQATAQVNVSAGASADAHLLFISVGIGYSASVAPSPVPLSVSVSAAGSSIMASVGSPPPVFIVLTPSGGISSEILSAIAWPLATIMVNALQPLAGQLMQAYSPYTILTIPPFTQNISGTSVTITVNVGNTGTWNGMLKAGGVLQLS
jgi:hypothetical protein